MSDDDGPPVELIRHRYVNGRISAKCDYGSAMEAARRYGGRVDQSTVTAYPDGEELLGRWSQLWPTGAAEGVDPA